MANVDTAIRFATAALLAGVWQAPLFALVAWLVLRVRPGLNATTRYTVLAAALFASVFLPLITATLTRPDPTGVVAPTVVRASPRVSASSSRVTAVSRVSGGAAAPLSNAGSRTAVLAPLTIPSVPHVRLAVPHAIARAIVFAWLAVAAALVARLGISLLHLERLKRDALPFSVAYRAQLPRWAAATKGSRNVRLCRSRQIAIPVAVGLGDAMILVPEHLLEELAPSDIDSVVLHELAHLRRADDWLNAFQRVAQAVLFFNPGIMWLAGQLDLEREVACDDWVVHEDDAVRYATCLTKVVETTRWPHRPVAAPGAFVTRRGMSIRIERLLASRRDIRVRTSFGPAGAVVAILAVLGSAAAFASPSIAYTVADAITVPPTRRAPQSVAARTAPVPAAAPHVKQITEVPLTPPEPATPATQDRVPSAPSAEAVSAIGAAARGLALAVVVPALSHAGSVVMHTPEIVADATTPNFVADLARVGYSNLSVDDLVALKSVGVTESFIRAVQGAGLGHPTIDELVQLWTLGVDPAFVRHMRQRYGSGLSIGEIVGMRAVGVSTTYADELAAAGLTGLTADQVRSLRALDVTPAYVRGLARAGYPNLSYDHIEQLKALGIDADVISRAEAQGLHHLSIEQLVKLRATGVL